MTLPRAAFAGCSALCALACGTATTAPSETLSDPGPRDAAKNEVLELDGVDDYASVGTARVPQIMRDQTFLLWFRPRGAGSGAAQDLQALFTLRRSDWSGIVLALDHDVPLAYNVFADRELARATAPAARGSWHHLAFVVEASSSTLYLDGVATVGDVPQTNRTPTQAFIGTLDGYSNLFHGAIDELRLYQRAFSSAEIQALAAGGRPNDTDPSVLYLPFDERSGARCYDRSGLANHAELGDGEPELMPSRVFADVP
ncbi:MAG TPA: LamG domain-containing protein [Polyangiaceae bacterium]|nr:LamG domain-containing protein [Polyangiaceae bacterium]